MSGALWHGGDIMNSTILIGNEQMDKEEFARFLVDAIRNDEEVRKAILGLAYSCPGIVTQI